ncbi:class I SAM-dependent methyltransferase [Saccharopolyspora erythraea]|uniref:class I SAM-dependent methyltransferase n=1 Tax=Saccharopolyspora erythraea TaxID=1836 RepID=UPI001BA7B31D|nr:class I SAM-dependent methyltransferase [Saccharopolyspora erythraea]QUH02910.1 class I SAM-dependent methyltransferase [Saccharopolyspora erythraea]
MTGALLRALDHFNAAHPWDHNAHHHAWILRRLPAMFSRALDVGCGSGDLARLLAGRADEVLAVDRDPSIVEHARSLSREYTNIDFVADDVTELELPGDQDVITCVATLHHLPFTTTLRRFRNALAPGGTLVVLGVYRERTAGDRMLSAAAAPANLVVGWLKTRARRRRGETGRPASMTAPTKPASMTFTEITEQARAELPGAVLRRHLFWRYSLVYRAPSAAR